mmetsp:Transcript_14919/g.47877  ORF Transcript_14919/g.47877 Transcript_14919/m.47877 type:complete len:359 (-) Transcript_14919:181-1257(-)
MGRFRDPPRGGLELIKSSPAQTLCRICCLGNLGGWLGRGAAPSLRTWPAGAHAPFRTWPAGAAAPASAPPLALLATSGALAAPPAAPPPAVLRPRLPLGASAPPPARLPRTVPPPRSAVRPRAARLLHRLPRRAVAHHAAPLPAACGTISTPCVTTSSSSASTSSTCSPRSPARPASSCSSSTTICDGHLDFTDTELDDRHGHNDKYDLHIRPPHSGEGLLHVESHEFQKKTLVSPSAVVPHQLNSQAPCFVMPQLVNLNNRSDFGLPEPLCKQHLYSDDPVVEKQHTLNDQPNVLLDERFLIGQPVSLVGLKSLKYNGLSGLVTDDLNASGRIGVLLWTELKPLASWPSTLWTHCPL